MGAPNAGKSTLLNQVLGQKVSITSSKPQTTRNRVVGIHTAPGVQAVLVDTPGIHERADNPLNQSMVRVAREALAEVDAVCWVLDASRVAARAEKGVSPLGPGYEALAELVSSEGQPLTVALNKVDLIARKWLLPVMAALGEHVPDAEIVPVSALRGDGVSELIAVWARQLPEGEALYPSDQLMENSERFVVAELIREKLFEKLHQELPYSLAVEIEQFDESGREGDKPTVEIFARILVERDSQKGIVIGKGGRVLKQVGIEARREIQALLGAHVYLELHASVARDWTRDGRVLRRLGYE